MRRLLIGVCTAALVLVTSSIMDAGAQTGSAGLPAEIDAYRSWTRMNADPLTDPSNPRLHRPFPDGTIVVRETLDPAAGFPRVLFVQRKDSAAAATRGWVFSGWQRAAADQPYQAIPIVDPVTRCLNCHAQVKNTDYVFTPYLNRPDNFPPRVALGGERVDIFNNQFGPRDLRVRVSATVVWANYDAVPHDVKAASLAFESGNLPVMGRYAYTFTQAGTVEYFCALHLEMRGRVIVER